MKNKKGFTLIELLAVIIILAVIALIATPIVLNVVDSARVEANRDSVYGLLDGAKLYYLEGQLDTNRLGIDGETNLIDKINVTGKRPSGGNVYIDNAGLIALSVVYDKVCYKKGFNENEITETKNIEECETKINDKTTPEITTVVTSKTDRIKVNLTCSDFESGIIKYEYKIDDKEWIESNNEYIFENLEKEREYEIKTRCTNGVNLVSEESKKISTKRIINPEIAQISQEPSSGTYAVKRIIRITYDNTNIENAKNYYSYDGKTWVEVNDTKIDLEFTSNSLLYAKTTDDINTSAYATYSVVNIDTIKPTLTLSKITYEEGFNNWNDSRISNGILTLSESGTVCSNYYNVNKEPWYVMFDGYTTSSSIKSDIEGGIHSSVYYYDENYNGTVSNNGLSANGWAGDLKINTWRNEFIWDKVGYGTQYLKYCFLTGNEYSQPTVKIRNFRLYGQLYNTFYLINVNPNDNIGIDVTKYAKGNVDISYFKSNGSIATSNEIRVTENGIYTVYVKDLAGNEVISTIEIDKILYKDSVLN